MRGLRVWRGEGSGAISQEPLGSQTSPSTMPEDHHRHPGPVPGWCLPGDTAVAFVCPLPAGTGRNVRVAHGEGARARSSFPNHTFVKIYPVNLA